MEKPKRPPYRSLLGGWSDRLLELIPEWLDLKTIGKGISYFAAGFVISLIIGWLIFPAALYSEQKQPFNFSHEAHLNPDIGISGETEVDRCLFCHGFREDGTFEGIPRLEKCTMCHSDPGFPMGDSPDEKAFLEDHVATGKEVPWLSYYRQPDCVYFSHIAHVKMGGMDCGLCHGDHGHTDELPVYQENRLTGYSINIYGKHISGYEKNAWDSMKMDDCADCHRETGKLHENSCFVCHK